MEKPCKTRMIRAGVLFALAVMSVTGVFAMLQDKAILPPAREYVEQSQDKALTAFITISVVKGIVAVVEGSDVVGIEVGDIVQPLYDAIDITWKVLAASLATLYALEVLLVLCGTLGRFFLSALFIALLAMQFTRCDILRRAAFSAGILAFFFFAAIPLTLVVAGHLSEGYSKNVRLEFDSRMEQFRSEFQERVEEIQDGDLVALENWPNLRISFPKIEIVKAILIDMKELVEKLPELLFRTGVTWLLDVALIPMGLLFILYKLALLFMGSVFGSPATRPRKLPVPEERS
jgi:hypothetical protein